ncbi:prostatic spermine-binding protein isoform X1 [Manihot esculenta]|uniref:Uncharacterized protein n=2 Tax=Manihot esculenta TaxID=3983 RepID=A0A2C9W1H3_MANES|nr:prostatic spermine-binding protein isoform X1 [Manihot esculenta]OAY52761.1 hypothetical protein MANES_04G109000v8 [Manihot esculenta]
MHMDSLSLRCNTSNLERILCSMVQSLVVETALLAQKSLLCLLFVMRSLPDDVGAVQDLMATDMRFPFSELNRSEEPSAECKDAGETEDDSDDGDGDGDDDDDSNGEEGTDDEEDDSDAEASGDGESDDDDDGNDDDEEGDDDDEDDDDDDDEDDEEGEETQPPSKRKK